MLGCVIFKGNRFVNAVIIYVSVSMRLLNIIGNTSSWLYLLPLLPFSSCIQVAVQIEVANQSASKKRQLPPIHAIVLPLRGCVIPSCSYHRQGNSNNWVNHISEPFTTAGGWVRGKWKETHVRTALWSIQFCQHGDWEKAKLVDECISIGIYWGFLTSERLCLRFKRILRFLAQEGNRWDISSL